MNLLDLLLQACQSSSGPRPSKSHREQPSPRESLESCPAMVCRLPCIQSPESGQTVSWLDQGCRPVQPLWLPALAEEGRFSTLMLSAFCHRSLVSEAGVKDQLVKACGGQGKSLPPPADMAIPLSTLQFGNSRCQQSCRFLKSWAWICLCGEVGPLWAVACLPALVLGSRAKSPAGVPGEGERAQRGQVVMPFYHHSLVCFPVNSFLACL